MDKIIKIVIREDGSIDATEEGNNLRSIEHLKALTRKLYVSYRVIETAIKSRQKTKKEWITGELENGLPSLKRLFEKHNGLKKYNTPLAERKGKR